MVYSDEANEEINILIKMTLDMINLSLEAFINSDKNKAIESFRFT